MSKATFKDSGVHDQISSLSKVRVNLAEDLRHAGHALKLNPKSQLIKSIISRDIARYIEVGVRIKALERMRDDLEKLFNNR